MSKDQGKITPLEIIELKEFVSKFFGKKPYNAIDEILADERYLSLNAEKKAVFSLLLTQAIRT